MLFACFCPDSRIRLCSYHPEIIEANNPTAQCEFWITLSMSQSLIDQVIWYLKWWDADLDVSGFSLRSFFSFMSFYIVKTAEYLILR